MSIFCVSITLSSNDSASAEVPGCDTDCAGVCNGDAVVDDCGDCNGDNACHTGSLSLGSFDVDAGTLEVMYDFSAPVAGFQFDLTGLASSGSGDIIGKAATANSHIGQITAAVNGTVLGGKLTCLEAPAGGDPDINLW